MTSWFINGAAWSNLLQTDRVSQDFNFRKFEKACKSLRKIKKCLIWQNFFTPYSFLVDATQTDDRLTFYLPYTCRQKLLTY